MVLVGRFLRICRSVGRSADGVGLMLLVLFLLLRLVCCLLAVVGNKHGWWLVLWEVLWGWYTAVG